MKIVLGADHRGVALKASLIEYLRSKGHETVDVGAFSEDSCDYPSYCQRAGNMVASEEADAGVFICYTGIGSSIALNKIKGVRASLVHNVKGARLTRQHNDSNMLVLGSAFTDVQTARRITGEYFKAEFEGGRHIKRVEMISKIENGEKI